MHSLSYSPTSEAADFIALNIDGSPRTPQLNNDPEPQNLLVTEQSEENEDSTPVSNNRPFQDRNANRFKPPKSQKAISEVLNNSRDESAIELLKPLALESKRIQNSEEKLKEQIKTGEKALTKDNVSQAESMNQSSDAEKEEIQNNREKDNNDDDYDSEGGFSVDEIDANILDQAKGKEKLSSEAGGAKQVSRKRKFSVDSNDSNQDHLDDSLYIEGQKLIQAASTKRRKIRVGILFGYLLVLIILTSVLVTSYYLRDEIILSNLKDLEFDLDNCSLLITDHTNDEISSSIYVRYQVTKDLITAKSKAKFYASSTSEKLEVLNQFQTAYCSVQLFIKESTILKSLQINCPSCNVTQDTSFQLEIEETLELSGNELNANFRNLKVGSLSFNVEAGYLQLNNIESSSTSNIEMSIRGDIIIQSTKDFQVNVTTDTQAFCFNAPYVDQVSTNNRCAFSKVGPESNLPNTDCNVIYNVCSSKNCDPEAKYIILSNEGNVFANLIPEVGRPTIPRKSKMIKGMIYDAGINFNSDAKAAIDNFNQFVADQSKGNVLSILNLGSFESRSSRFTKWIISSAPSLSLLKPWWVGTISATVLNSYIDNNKGFLLPGVCPFMPEYTQQNVLDVQNLISKLVHTQTKLITFVDDVDTPIPPLSPENNTGIFHFPQGRNMFDRWLSLVLLDDGDILVEDNDYSKKPEILGAIILSLIIAGLASYFITELVIVGINWMYYKLIDLTRHLEMYKTENSKRSKYFHKPKKIIGHIDHIQQKKYTFINLIRNIPSPASFMEYLSLILARQFSNSTERFYQLLFREVDPIKDERQDRRKEMLRGADAKVLYEKFCFVNHLIEEKLSDENNLKILQKYGFTIMTLEEMPLEVFRKITIKNYDKFRIQISPEEERMSSLELFVAKNVDITEFEEDQIEVKEFIKVYNQFCDFNNLTKVLVSSSLMTEKYGIPADLIPQQLITRQKEESAGLQSFLMSKLSIKFVKRFAAKEKIYVIDTSRLDQNFTLLMGNFTYSKNRKLASAVKDLILFPNWWLWDLFTVFSHLVFLGFLTLPFVALAMLNESQYQPWSLKEGSNLIAFSDLKRDPIGLIRNLYWISFPWNRIIMITATILWFLGLVDLISYYLQMSFPQDGAFEKGKDQGERWWKKIFTQLEWLIVLFVLSCYFGYIVLVSVWLLIGAFINPDAFLPFASASLTFVTFVITKYRTLRDTGIQGMAAISGYLTHVFSRHNSIFFEKMAKKLENLTELGISQARSFLKSETFLAMTDKYIGSGILDTKSLLEFSEKIKSLKEKDVLGELEAIKTVSFDAINREIKNFRANIQEKVILKVKEEAAKREIPPLIIDFVIALALKDEEKIQGVLKEIITVFYQKTKMPLKSGELILELLFPQTFKKEEKVMFLTTKIFKIIFENFKLNLVKGLTPEMMLNIFGNLNNIQDSKINGFTSCIKELLEAKSKEENSNKEIDFIHKVLDFVSILKNESQNYPKFKEYCLSLLFSVTNLVSKSDTEAKTSKDLVQLLAILVSKDEVISDFYSKNALKSFDILKLVNRLFKNTSIKIVPKSITGSLAAKNFVPNLIYLAISYAKDETCNLPKELIKDLNDMLGTGNINRKDLTPFLFNIANTAFSNHLYTYQCLNECISNSGLDQDLQELCRMLICYSIRDDISSVLNIQFEIENNQYFSRIAAHLKIKSSRLLGLVNFLHDKKDYKQANVFLKSFIKRFGLKAQDLKDFRPLIDLLFSDDEIATLRAVKALSLKHRNFLLMGKGILNPKYVSRNEFEELGINGPELLREKDSFSDLQNNNFELWKNRLINNITENLEQELDPIKYRELKKHASLIIAYLSDWDSQNFSKKGLTTLLNKLNNQDNEIKDKINSDDDIDFLAALFLMKDLKLRNGKRINIFSKENEFNISHIAEHLSINSEGLKIFLKMLLVNSKQSMLDGLLFFFPEQKDNQDTLKRVIDFCFNQVIKLQDQIEFIDNTLPKYFQSNQNIKTNISSGLIKLFSFGNKTSLSIREILDINAGEILKLEPKFQQSSLNNVFKLVLMAKGMLPEGEVINLLKIKDEKILTLFKIFTKSGRANRMGLLSDLLPEEKNPIKVFLALYAYCTRLECKIKFYVQEKKGQLKKIQKAVKPYLASCFGVYPEILDLLEVAFLFDRSEFFKKGLQIIKRFRTSFLDENLMEILFNLSLGENYNTNYLANKLEVSSDIVEFFMIIRRLIAKRTRLVGFEQVLHSSSVKKVLSKLKIAAPEFISLLRLIFDFPKNKESITETISNIGLINNKDKNETNSVETIDIDLLEALINFEKISFDPKIDRFENENMLNNLKRKTETLLESLGYEGITNNAFIILAIARGNYLLIKDPKYLDWAFPNSDPNSNQILRSMTMAICGLINSNIQVSSDLSREIDKFIQHQSIVEAVPNNSLAYAVYLAYRTLDIPPCWAQAFLFDEEIYNQIDTRINRLNKQFVLAIVLNFINIPDFFGDYVALNEWTNESYKFYMKHNKRAKINNQLDTLDIFSKFSFQYEKIKEFASKSDLLKKRFWYNLFSKQSTFNVKVNQSILYILNDIELTTKFASDLAESPQNFLENIAQHQIAKNNSELNVKEEMGKLIKKILLVSFKILTKQTSQETKSEDYRLTNLCILGTIVKLRQRLELRMPYNRVLYNLHQLVTNLERKLYLDERFWKMSKFKILKLAGISLGLQISNIVEWCLPPSLFPYSFLKQLEENGSKEAINKIKEEKSKFVVECQHSFEQIGDLGELGGCLQDYVDLTTTLLTLDDWESLESALGLSQKYLKLGNNEFITNLDKEDERQPIKSQNKSNFRSKELISFTDAFDSEKMIDLKTGLPADAVENKLIEFEIVLTDSKINLFQSIASGSSLYIGKDHALSLKNEKNNTIIYMALTALQCDRKQSKFNQKVFKKCLNILSLHMKSNIKHLKELLIFIITGNSLLNSTLNALMIDEVLINLLFFGFKGVDEEEGAEEERDDILQNEEKIQKILSNKLGIDYWSRDFQMLRVLRQAYQFKQSGWITLVQQSTIIPMTNEDQNDHPLVKLVKIIDFAKLKKLTKSPHEKKIYYFIKKQLDKSISTTLFEEMILGSSFNTFVKSSKNLVVMQQVFLGIIDLDFRPIFDKLILTDEGNNSKLLSIEEFLFLIGSKNPDQSDIRSLNTYITLAVKNLGVFRNRPNYKKVIEEISDHVANSGFLVDQNSLESPIRLNLTHLLIGSIACDAELILNALISANPTEGNLLYNLFGYLNYTKLISSPDFKSKKNYQGFAQIILSNTESKVNYLKKKIQPDKFKEENLLKVSSFENTTSKVSELLDVIQTDGFQPMSLYEYVCVTFDQYAVGDISENFYSCICNGTVLSSLFQKMNDKSLQGSLNFILKIGQVISGPNKVEMNSLRNIISYFEDLIKLIQNSYPQLALQKLVPFVTIILKILIAKGSKNRTDNKNIQREIFILLKELFLKIDNFSEYDLISELINVGFGLNIKGDIENEPFSAASLDSYERVEIFFGKVLPAIFPGLNEYLNINDLKDIYHLSVSLRKDLVKDYEDPIKMRILVKDLMKLLEKFGVFETQIVNSVISSLEGDLEGLKALAYILDPSLSKEVLNNMIVYIQEARGMFNFDFINKLNISMNENEAQTKSKKKNKEVLTTLRKKMEEGKISNKDLFKLADEEGDQNGSISEKEFLTLAKRLGFNLTKHRVAEIFAKIKLEAKKQAYDNDLNEKEFEQALEYLKEKNSQQALKLLNITPEMLTAVLIRLVLLLILIFIFIFLAISAFGLGGTFSSIISSIFPIISGLSLGKQKDSDKNKLEEKSISEASETGFEIIASNEL